MSAHEKQCLLTVSGEYVGRAPFSRNDGTGAVQGTLARPSWLVPKHSVKTGN